MTPADQKAVRREIVVNAPIDHAFATFVERFGDFKPKERNLLGAPITSTTFEPQVGGHIFDRAEDGSECHWARVLAYDPPNRVVFSWDISPYWQLESDPSHASEVEVRFVPESPDRTRLELEHRNIDRHGPGWAGVRDGVEGNTGWPLYLARVRGLVERSGLNAPITATIEVDRSAEVVFADAIDPSRFSEWQKGVIHGAMVTAGAPKVGDRCLTTRRVGLGQRAVTAEVVHIDPPSTWGVRGVQWAIRAGVDVAVESLPGARARLTISIEFEGRGIGHFLVPLIVEREARREMPANLAAPKQRLEADPRSRRGPQ